MQGSQRMDNVSGTHVQTIVGVFDDAASVQHALAALKDAGFATDAISVMARGQEHNGGPDEGRVLVSVSVTNAGSLQQAETAFSASNALTIHRQQTLEPSFTITQEREEENAAATARMTTEDMLNNPANDQPISEPLGQNPGGLSRAAQGVVPPPSDHFDPVQRERAERNTYLSDNTGTNAPAGDDATFDPETAPDTVARDTGLVDEYHGRPKETDRLNRYGVGSDRTI